MRKRIISMMLVMAMVVGMIPQMVLAAAGENLSSILDNLSTSREII